MRWTDLISEYASEVYQVSYNLMDRVKDGELDWKPETGSNWMTTGQLLEHMTGACGLCMKGFVTGEWEMPEGFDPETADMLPPAEKLPRVTSVKEAKEKLAADQKVAEAMIAEAGEERLENEKVTAPWDPRERPLGRHLFDMVGHLESHKNQLYYYLKLQGQPVNTHTLWGVGEPTT